MLTRNKVGLWVLLVSLALAQAVLVFVFHEKSEAYAVNEAKKQALNALLVHRAIHAYVTQIQRPEIYRLKQEGKLYPAYFAPSVMSFTFISRSVKDLLNQQRALHGLDPILFKLATDNPRNPVNQADPMEAALLRRMNDEGLQEFEQIVERQGEKFLYLAVPVERSSSACMKCHGDPKEAPAELIALYGDKAGFYEPPERIRAFISIHSPLKAALADADHMADILTWSTFVVLSGIYGLVVFFTRRIDRQQRRIIEQNAGLSLLSVTDALTGCLNRLGLQQRVEELVSRAVRFHHPLSLLILDLDEFKQVNDQFGHPEGDEVLRYVVRTVQSRLRVSDIFGRWGGEEFLVMAPHLDLAGATRLAEKLREGIETSGGTPHVRITASIGVTQMLAGEGFDATLERADQALYQAKESGRNRVVSLAPPAAG